MEVLVAGGQRSERRSPSVTDQLSLDSHQQLLLED